MPIAWPRWPRAWRITPLPPAGVAVNAGAGVTAGAGEVRYLVLADHATPYLLARVRWPDVAQAISARCPDWLDDIGLLDLPYEPSAVAVSFTQAASVAAAWGRQLREDPAVNAPTFIRRMPANWSDMTPGERRAFGLESAARPGVSARRLRRVRASQAPAGAPVPVAAAVNGYHSAGQLSAAGRHRLGVAASGPVSEAAERRRHVRVRVDGRVHIRSGQSTISAPLVDLSEGGMRCVLPDDPVALLPGEALSGPFLLEGEAAKSRICLAVPGRISWIHDGRSGTHFGVTYGELKAGEIDGLQRFLVTAGSKRG
ncbi:MAG TPA: PilZ domain-containing protein [Trebonia sp.]|nr:PilZ domain-containing protein [Trebonia sp.]